MGGFSIRELYSDIGYLIWKKLIAHSRPPQPICVLYDTDPSFLAQEIRVVKQFSKRVKSRSYTELWNPHWLGPSALNIAISAHQGYCSMCLCTVLHSFIVGNPSCLLDQPHCLLLWNWQFRILSLPAARQMASVCGERRLRKGLANASQRTSDLTFPERHGQAWLQVGIDLPCSS